MGKQWKSIEDKLGDASLERVKNTEFSEGAAFLEEGVSRRSFLKMLGGTLAIAGLTGCSIRKPYQKIVPYARKMKHVTPGSPTFYATTFALNDTVAGILVETHEGRPTKIEGNPTYPGASGSSTVYQQAAVLDLYDPDRLKNPQLLKEDASLNQFKDWVTLERKRLRQTKGKGFRVLIENTQSITAHALLTKLKKSYPYMEVLRYEAVNAENQIHGLHAVTGDYIKPMYDFNRADTIVSFGDDFLSEGPFQLEYAESFSKRRDPDNKMNRLYMIEQMFTPTGAKADHHYPVRVSDQELVLSQLLLKVANKLSYSTQAITGLQKMPVRIGKLDSHVLEVIADDLLSTRGRSLVTVGRQLSPQMHQLAFILNSILGNNFKTVSYLQSSFYGRSPFLHQSSTASIATLIADLDQGDVDTLLVVGGNPAYALPSSSGFSKSMSKAKHRVHLTSLVNETSLLCNWVVPRLNFLETWNDYSSIKGVESISQPVITPLVTGLSDLECLNLFVRSHRSAYSLVRDTWSAYSNDVFLNKLHDGYMLQRLRKTYPTLKSSVVLNSPRSTTDSQLRHLEVVSMEDLTVYDGRFSNNPWLQELPDPIHKLTWGNAAFISPSTAKSFSLNTGDVVTLQSSAAQIEIPVFIAPGHAVDSITIPMGYGKVASGLIDKEIGVNPASLFSLESVFTDVTLIATGKQFDFASTQNHSFMESRPHYRYTTLEGYRHNPNFANEQVHVPYDKPLWDEHSYDRGYQWGMTIDLAKCISCNACITSCQAENNIPVVGSEEIKNGREMHWMRLDRYYEGDDVDSPMLVQQPVTCLHCENAPCEQVCPVAATVHDDEGLNVMVYNRCVGTRYCSDNCPAKVRRFNFFDYHQRSPHATKKTRKHLFDYMREPDKNIAKQFNPDVTVRMRGVMEKCTYCIQRIKGATQKASNEGRVINDGEVVTACQQACPSKAIIMGNILDKKSKVYKERNKKREYSILEQLLLEARTTYLAAVLNPNKALGLVKSTNHKELHHG